MELESKIRTLITTAFPGAVVTIKDPRKDGAHLELYVEYEGFRNKSLIEQHKMIHEVLGETLKEVHALGIHTSIPKKEKPE